MKISLNWIKKFVDIDKYNPYELSEILTEKTVEVEEIIHIAENLDKIVVGEIKQIKPHPNADKLRLCVTDIGEDEVQIVCGGDNIREGMKVAVALPGARVRWHGEGDLVTLEKTKIRGEESYGMICASAEIGLAESTADQQEGEKGVMDLETDASPGTPLEKALGIDDVVLDVDNKSITHRPDLWSHTGIAREISAVCDVDFKADDYFNLDLIQKDLDSYPVSENIKINLNKDISSHYIAVKISNIKIEESPEWLKKTLQSIGQKSINNIVDIANYVMFEVGQPVHTFDAKKVSDDDRYDISVDYAQDELTLKALDENEYKIDNSVPLIWINKSPSAIAGVIGGYDSQVDSSTTEILLESAYFNHKAIRISSKSVNLRTEASARFEKNINLFSPMIGVWRFLSLVKEIIPSANIDFIACEKNFEAEDRVIDLDLSEIKAKTGIDISFDDIKANLEKLGFEVNESETLSVHVPFWRYTDINIKEDVYEEIVRVYGLNSINTEEDDDIYSRDAIFSYRERFVKRYLTLSGKIWEVENHSFDNDKMAEFLQLSDDRWEINNPVSSECKFLRKSLLPNLLQNVKDNARFYDSIKLFEIGRVFLNQTNDDKLPNQPYRLGIIFYDKNKLKTDLFLDLKGMLNNLFEHLDIIAVYEEADADFDYIYGGKVLNIYTEGKNIGYMYIFDDKKTSSVKINYPMVYADIDWEYLKDLELPFVQFKKINEYPEVDRDISVIVDKKISYSTVEETIRSSATLLKRLQLFDVYEGEQIGEGKKSYAWHLYFGSDERTLTSDEVNSEVEAIIKKLSENIGAEVRTN